MRPIEILREAIRNVGTGVTRPLVLAGLFVLLVVGIAGTDVRVLVNANIDLVRWRNAGASITIVHAEGAIDGGACEALSGTAGIVASGAGRSAGQDLPIPALPFGSPTYAEVTPGFARLVSSAAGGGGTARAATLDSLAQGGLLLSEPLAAVLDRGPGSTLDTAHGSVRVAGAYAVPNDGRQSNLGYASLAQVPAQGLFDYCWAEVWPPDPAVSSLVRVTVDPHQPDVKVSTGQLNSTLGVDMDALGQYRGRLTRHAPLAAAVAGLLLGFVSIRLRRLEIASALHAGVSHRALAAQLACEAAIWLSAAAVMTGPLLWFAARAGNPLSAAPMMEPIAAGLVAAATATVAGVLISLSLTREEHLFRYFKNR